LKSLTASLLSAQRSASAAPYVRARFADYDGYARRLRLVQHYAGSEPVNFHAACIAPDGSLVRARLDGTTLYVSRVAAPGPGSTFSSWTSLETGIASTGGIALCVRSTEVRLFFLAAGNVNIRERISTDNGASWAAAATIVSTGGAKTEIAAAASDGSGGSSGDVLLVWSEGAVVYRSRYVSPTWGARTAATPTFASVTGLAVAYLLDWQVIVTGTQVTTAHPRVYGVRYGDGVNQATDTWGTPREVTGAAFGSDVSFAAPSVAYESGAWRLFFAESYAGDVAYTRLQWSTLALAHDFNEEQWREPVAFDYAGAKGAAVAVAASRVWLCSAETVWSSALPAFAELDASDAVLEARVAVDGGGGKVELELEASLWGPSGEGLLQRGARLQLTPGYRTSAGAEVAAPYSYWVESVELVTGGRPHVLVKARDGWSLLERWRARRQFVWAAGVKTVSQLLLFLTARAGCEFASDGTSTPLTTLQPAFTVHAGESGLTAVRRLLAMVEDLARWDGATLVSLLTAAGDASTYAAGVAHAVLEARYAGGGPDVNRVRVVGVTGVYGEAVDFGDAEASGERIAQVLDLNLDTSGEVADRAAAVLRKAAIAAELGELRLFGVHAGVELWDVVDVTDAQAGLSASKRRVTGYAWSFRGKDGRYEIELTLGAV